MSYRNLAIIVLGLLILFLSLCNCSSMTETEEPVFTYTDVYVRIEDEGNSSWLVNGYMSSTNYNEIQYCFSSDVPENVRIDLIKKQNTLMQFLKKQGLTCDGFSLYLLKGIQSRYDESESALYLDDSAQGSVHHILLTLKAIFGEFTDFGYLYALSCRVASELGWERVVSATFDPMVFENSPLLLNLVYPCFSEAYATTEQIEACKALSIKLLDNLENVYEGPEIFQAEVLRYADSKNIDFHKSYLTFSYGGSHCPLKVRSRYLDIALWSNYEGSCTLTEKSIKEDPMFCFENMVEFLEFTDNDLTEIRRRFDYNEDGLISVTVCSINIVMNGGDAYGGYFVPSDQGSTISLADIYAISHEYTHYLDYLCDEDSTDDVNWCAEVLAVYFGKNMSYRERLVRGESGAEDVYTVDILSRIIGRPFDDTDDEILFQTVMTALQDNPRYQLISLYNGRLSFGWFFAATYGEDALIRCMMCPSDTKSVIGCRMDDVVDSWCLWLKNFKIDV
ncbi:MAG: hypothetical protein IJD10_01475 [Clostridia bacterium]|nr:hypothetical protein [Clostridia bacterium]